MFHRHLLSRPRCFGVLAALTLCVVSGSYAFADEPVGEPGAAESVPTDGTTRPGGPVADRSCMLWTLNLRGAVDPSDIAAVSSVIASGVSRVAGLDVFAVETFPQRPGCGFSDLNCMVAFAADKGARVLIYGDLSRVGDSWLLSLFSVTTRREGGVSRASSRSFETLGDLRAGVDGMVNDLIGFRAGDRSASERRDPSSLTRHRVTVSPTAVGMRKGDFTVTGYGLGLWELQYGVHENVQVGALTMLPVGIAGLIPMVSAHYRVNEHFAVGGGAYAGIFGSFADMDLVDDAFVVLYGGSVQLTGIWGRHVLNLSFIVGSAAGRLSYDAGDDEGDVDSFSNLDGAYMLPSVGYRFEVHPNWSLQFEVAIPVFAGPDISMGTQETVPLVFYGVRGHGGLVYGDFGFVLPCHEEYFENIWKYTPLGIPYFSLGFAF